MKWGSRFTPAGPRPGTPVKDRGTYLYFKSDINGMWSWHLRTPDGHTVNSSSELFASYDACEADAKKSGLGEYVQPEGKKNPGAAKGSKPRRET